MERLQKLSRQELLNLRARVADALAAHGEFDEEMHDRERHACRLFTVAEGVPWLDRNRLDRLTRSFEAWAEAARNSRARRSRERVVIIYLLLRYTGARPGEILALDESKHFDFQRNTVTIRDEDKSREVPLPVEVMGRIQEHCAKYGLEDVREDGKRERLFDLDQGFLRRKFHEQQARSGLPKELLNPRVLRNSRAVELLQGGMPMRAVQALLGHGTTDITASYVKLAENDLRHIIRHHCDKEFGMQTSARNTFHGTVAQIVSSSILCEVTLKTESGYEVSAVVTNQSRDRLGLVEGAKATAMVKASWVILGKCDKKPSASKKNAFPGVVTGIESDGLMVEVTGALDDGTPVCALVTTESYDALDLGEGNAFMFMFKAMSVIVS
ncbi:molybdenum-pterin-binding protein [Oceanidesulfovibrio indonesiensis]|uniref:Molybdenum-pterin-binding protein n=1 Tax=Oceanidesulfovibrio indonesiensis TaxID=54767 RepID=A0A7M3MCZ6_9BACT|nr:TOBE domain-containing protein [Oceanidesulfovibrio indonesiensis]TVM16355.1 molybdenum-pterin-binding protein [Oceanidesulfovibrio indonesiensis]